MGSGDKPAVGVTRSAAAAEPAPDLATYELDPDGRDRQLQRLAKVKAERDPAAVGAALTTLAKAAASEAANLLHNPIDCANAYCPAGGMVSAPKGAWARVPRPGVVR